MCWADGVLQLDTVARIDRIYTSIPTGTLLDMSPISDTLGAAALGPGIMGRPFGDPGPILAGAPRGSRPHNAASPIAFPATGLRISPHGILVYSGGLGAR